MSSDATASEEVLWEGRFIAAKRRGKWEYVSRTRGVSAAVILAIEDEHVLLVEQFRAPLQAMCLELPAGLIGDETLGEEAEAAAMRELEEETGYRAREMIDLGRFHASPGMSSEAFHLLRAEGLIKTGQGGGVPGEDIIVHRIPMAELAEFVARKRAAGCSVDSKILLLLGPSLLEAEAAD